MSRPIEETPVLYGKDARRFEKLMQEAQYVKLDEQEVARIRRNHKLMTSLYVKNQK